MKVKRHFGSLGEKGIADNFFHFSVEKRFTDGCYFILEWMLEFQSSSFLTTTTSTPTLCVSIIPRSSIASLKMIITFCVLVYVFLLRAPKWYAVNKSHKIYLNLSHIRRTCEEEQQKFLPSVILRKQTTMTTTAKFFLRSSIAFMCVKYINFYWNLCRTQKRKWSTAM